MAAPATEAKTPETKTTEAKPTQKVETVPLFNPNDGFSGRDGGPYLDEVQARQSERYRAAIEGRDEADVPPVNAGIPLLSAGQIAPALNMTAGLPSQEGRNIVSSDAAFKAHVDDDEILLQARGATHQTVEDGTDSLGATDQDVKDAVKPAGKPLPAPEPTPAIESAAL